MTNDHTAATLASVPGTKTTQRTVSRRGTSPTRRFLIIMTPEFITRWIALESAEREAAVKVLTPAELLKALISSEIALHDLSSLPEGALAGPDSVPEAVTAWEFVRAFLPLAYARMGELFTR